MDRCKRLFTGKNIVKLLSPFQSNFAELLGLPTSVVVGKGSSASGSEAFRWTSGGGMIGLGDLADGGFESRAYGVSSDGASVSGSGMSASGRRAFLWTGGSGMVNLGTLGPGGSSSRS